MLLLYVSKVHLPGQIADYCGALFACCMVCHGELVALKPAPRHLTSFYLMVAVGGALGGVTVGLIAPLVFRGYTELPLALVLCFAAGILVPGLRDIRLPRPAQLAQHGAIGLVIGLSLIPTIKQRTKERGRIIAVVRNFYGLLRVREEHGGTKDSVRTLLHGWIIHGYQYQAAEWRRAPTSYYNEKSGVGLAVLNHPRRVAGVPGQSDLRIGVVGLGTGTMAVYGRAGDYVRFYEINPAVLRLSRSGLFTHLSDCPARVDVVLGDARLSLERELQQGSQQLDLLAMDAFSGDAVPAHLLTREAFELYLRHLRPPNGALVVHVSNRWLDLQPVVWKAAKHFNLDACLVSYDSDSDRFCSSYWMVLTTGRNYLRSLDVDDAAWSDTGKRHVRMWTDDFYNLFQIIK
jgi:xanthosine utilization system XapX-like protein